MGFFDGVPLRETVAVDLRRARSAAWGRRVLELHAGGLDAGDAQRAAICRCPLERDRLYRSAQHVGAGGVDRHTETTYGTTFLDLKSDGPTVIESPANSLSFVDDLWQRYVADMGNAGPIEAGAAGTCSCRLDTTGTSPTAITCSGRRRTRTGW